MPKSAGGPGTAWNIVPACLPCNQRKADLMPADHCPTCVRALERFWQGQNAERLADSIDWPFVHVCRPDGPATFIGRPTPWLIICDRHTGRVGQSPRWSAALQLAHIHAKNHADGIYGARGGRL